MRDFNTLAASAGDWYPALLQSVRRRRAGPIAGSTSPVFGPTTIIFGVTPPVVPKMRPSGGGSGIGGPQSATNVLMNRRSASSSVGGTGKSGSGSAAGKSEWGEDESSGRARERRLKERLKKWEKGEKLLLADELPTLQSTSSPSDDIPSPRGGVSEGGFPGLVTGSSGGPFGSLSGVLPGSVLQALIGPSDPRSGFGSSSSPFSSPSFDGTDGSASPNNFFRSSVVVPSRRSVESEKISRVSRRREINELTVRMALASVGGALPPLDVPFLESALGQAEVDGTQPTERADLVRMWDAWGRVVVVWSVVKQVADRALGSVSIAQQEHELQSKSQSKSRKTPKLTLDPTVVPWSAIARAFLTKASASAMRRHWAVETAKMGEREGGEESANADGKRGREEEVDEVIERVKQESDLDEHEQRLLGCIVDPRESGITPCRLAGID